MASSIPSELRLSKVSKSAIQKLLPTIQKSGIAFPEHYESLKATSSFGKTVLVALETCRMTPIGPLAASHAYVISEAGEVTKSEIKLSPAPTWAKIFPSGAVVLGSPSLQLGAYLGIVQPSGETSLFRNTEAYVEFSHDSEVLIDLAVQKRYSAAPEKQPPKPRMRAGAVFGDTGQARSCTTVCQYYLRDSAAGVSIESRELSCQILGYTLRSLGSNYDTSMAFWKLFFENFEDFPGLSYEIFHPLWKEHFPSTEQPFTASRVPLSQLIARFKDWQQTPEWSAYQFAVSELFYRLGIHDQKFDARHFDVFETVAVSKILGIASLETRLGLYSNRELRHTLMADFIDGMPPALLREVCEAKLQIQSKLERASRVR